MSTPNVSRILPKEFFEQNTLTVAQKLLGKVLVKGDKSGIITETEGYLGKSDPAAHSYSGIPTKRTAPLFESPGQIYVYRIHQVFCLNVVTFQKGLGEAVLIRSLDWVKGPGRLCREMKINLSHNYAQVSSPNSEIQILDGKQLDFVATPRIGISKAKEYLYRFVASDI